MAPSARPDIRVICFDLGYTLINFEGDFYQVLSDSYLALGESLIRAGLTINAETFSRKFERTIAEYYRTREIDMIERPVEGYLNQTLSDFGYSALPDDVIQNALNDMYRLTESYWHLEADALETLETLKVMGFSLGLITNAANAANSNRLIDKFGLRHFFDAILISADEMIRKPDTRIYARALHRLNAEPKQAVMVGDTLTADIQGAQNTGLFAVWIKRRAVRFVNLSLQLNFHPDATIDDLIELPEVIKTLK